MRIWPGLLLLLCGDAAAIVPTPADGPGIGVRRYRSEAVFLPGVPARDYRFHQDSPHVIAVSAPAVPLGALGVVVDPAIRGFSYDPGLSYARKFGPMPIAGADGAPRRAKLFQFIGGDTLRIDHCFVSGMAMSLTEDGDYVVSFRADQNPRTIDQTRGPAVVPEVIRPSVRQTSQILRNRFFVSVRGYAGRPTPDPLNASAMAEPVAMEVVVPGFWVERGNSLPVRIAGRLPAEQARYFDVIDRIEFEFFYEYQTGLKADLP